MTISDMHVWFRQYAQQMGMQNVRAILPEQIDLLINTSITDTVNQLIRENIGITNDRVITDNSKLGQINALRTLYRVVNLDMTDYSFMYLDASDRNFGRMSNMVKETGVPISSTNKVPPYLFLVDFSINYRQATHGLSGINGGAIPQFVTDSVETNYFPVRLIDDIYLADTLNDFVLKNRLRSPILVTYNNGTFDLYIDKFTKGTDNSYYLDNNLVPYRFRLAYIAKPAVVKYSEDIGGDNVDCDLPESMHVDILKHAVDLYRVAVSGSLSASQQQAQNQQRENARNNYRDEGNQQTQ